MKRYFNQEEIEKKMMGRIYINTEDLNIVVKRKNALCGYTLNFGNKWSWIIIFSFLIIVILFVIFII